MINNILEHINPIGFDIGIGIVDYLNRQLRKPFILAFIAASLMRIIPFWAAPLWYDENYTYLISRLSFGNMMQAISGDTHPPLYYLFIWGIEHLINRPVMIRLPSVIFSILSLWVFWNILNSWIFPHRPAFLRYLAWSIFAILPPQLYYAQEGRMYSLFVLLVLLMFYNGLYLLFDRRYTWRFILFGILTLYTHNYGLFYVAAIFIALLILFGKESFPAVIIGTGIIYISYLPWVLVLKSQMGNIAGNYWIASGSLSSGIYSLFRGYLSSNANSYLDIAAQIFFYSWLIYCIVQTRKIALIIMSIMPLALALIASWLWQPILLYRPFIASAPFITMLFVIPLRAFEIKKPITLMILGIFLIPLLIPRVFYFYYLNGRQKMSDGSYEALSTIKANWKTGDVIYSIGDGSYINLLPYIGIRPIYEAAECSPVMGELSEMTRDGLGIHPVSLDTLGGYRRIWIIGALSPLTPVCLNNEFTFWKEPPFLLLQNDDYILSGVWVKENR